MLTGNNPRFPRTTTVPSTNQTNAQAHGTIGGSGSTGTHPESILHQHKRVQVRRRGTTPSASGAPEFSVPTAGAQRPEKLMPRNPKEISMYNPQQADTIIRQHAERTARLVEERSRVRVPNGAVRNRFAVWAYRRQAG